MKGDFVRKIEQARCGDNAAIMHLIDKLSPLLKSTARKLFSLEYEDAYQELVLAVLQGLREIKYMDDDGQCMMYFVRIIKNKAAHLSIDRYKELSVTDEYEEIDVLNIPDKSSDFDNLFVRLWLSEIGKNYSEQYCLILYLSLYEGYSDREIAELMGLSRQYINRCKNKIISEIKNTLD
ncbi:MAG: sigma-70 family RNA polymerase sigma factor [Lachnospiraceae bacterium]|nr:sigma-70 family RNA polymerase sigma factor [Lachnospiraceae bacterium]